MVGFTLVELLVAMTVTLSVLGAALAAALPASTGFQTLPEHVDVQQRLRTAVATIRADVLAAMNGPSVGLLAGRASAWPAVRPCGWNGDPVSGAPGPCARPDTLSVVLEDRPLQVVTAAALEAGSDALVVARPAGCPAAARACEFSAGDRAVIADGTGSVDAFGVRWVSPDASVLEHEERFTEAYRAGAAVASAHIRTYYVVNDRDTGLLQLRRIDGASDLPVLDHLSSLVVEYFGNPTPPVVLDQQDGSPAVTYGPAPRRAAATADDEFGAFAESCAFTVVDGVPVSRIAPLPAGSDSLAPLPLALFTDGPWCPGPDAPGRFDVDLFRVRRIRVRVRTEAAAPVFRGGTLSLFAPRGASLDAGRVVPGLELRLDLAVRGSS